MYLLCAILKSVYKIPFAPFFDGSISGHRWRTLKRGTRTSSRCLLCRRQDNLELLLTHPGFLAQLRQSANETEVSAFTLSRISTENEGFKNWTGPLESS